MATKKTPTAAELARREAQSKNDPMTALMEQGRSNPMLALLIPDEDERKAALDSLRDENGKLRVTTIVEFLTEVFQASGQGN